MTEPKRRFVVCPAVWKLWVPDDGETEVDAVDVYGSDADDAAEGYVESKYDSESFRFLEREGALVHVRGADGSLSRVRVRAEATVNYHGVTESESADESWTVVSP